MSLSYRTIWISDVHLGTASCRAGDLLEFLAAVTAERIYLVGDIIDLVKMRGRIQLPAAHHQVLERLVALCASGTEIIYVPGNHDYQARDYIGREIFGVRILEEVSYETADGRRLLVIHGDVLDGQIRSGTNLEVFGAAAYGLLMQLDVVVNRLRTSLGHDYRSMSRQIKARIASANRYIERFEQVAASYAARRGFDGIVCGHIHRPAIRSVHGILYANDGDWVEHRSALAETADGQLQLLGVDGLPLGSAGADAAIPVAA